MARTADPVVRTALIEAAARRLADAGLEGLSIRGVAAEVGSSTSAVYTHFGSKDDLVAEVVQEAFDRLHSGLLAAPSTDDPVADLRGIGLAYRRNALANPHLYRVMFGLNPLELRIGGHTETSAVTVGLDAFGALVTAVARCTEGGLLLGDPTEVALIVWSAAHGAVMLELAGFLGDRCEAVFEAASDAALRAYLPERPR